MATRQVRTTQGGDRRPVLEVVGGTPSVLRGLQAILLEDGSFREPGTADQARRETDAGADQGTVLLVVHERGEPVRPAPREERPASTVVAAVCGEQALLQALRAGYDGVVDLEQPPAATTLAVRAALSGHLVLPTRLAQRLLPGCPPGTDLPSPDETEWLARLAAGCSVLDLAEAACLSERVMYRRLADLYRRLGVSTRTEAIALTARAGLLDAPGAAMSA